MSKRRRHIRSAAVRWVKPNAGELKCNIDVAVFQQQIKFEIGMCLRNNRGKFVRAKTLLKTEFLSSKEVETYGLLEAISRRCPTNYYLDRLQVSNWWHQWKSTRRNWVYFQICFIRRLANLVAHSLATASRLYASFQKNYLNPIWIAHIILLME